MRMALLGRARTDDGAQRAYELGMISRGRRPARPAARTAPSAWPSDRTQRAGADGGPPNARCGARWSWADRCDRTAYTWSYRHEGENCMSDGFGTLRDAEARALTVPVGWLINNRPRAAQRHERADARRVRRRLEGARRRPRGAGHRAHRRGPGVPDRGRRDRARHRRRRAWSATASRSRTSTCISPSGTSRSRSR